MSYQDAVKAKVKQNVFTLLKGLPKQPRFVHEQDAEAATLWYELLNKYTAQQLKDGTLQCMESWEKETWPSPQHIKYCVDMKISQTTRELQEANKPKEVKYHPEPDWEKARELARPASEKLAELPEDDQRNILTNIYIKVFKLNGSYPRTYVRNAAMMKSYGVHMALTSIAHTAGAEGVLAVEQEINRVQNNG